MPCGCALPTIVGTKDRLQGGGQGRDGAAAGQATLPQVIHVVCPQVFSCKLLHLPAGEDEGARRCQLPHRVLHQFRTNDTAFSSEKAAKPHRGEASVAAPHHADGSCSGTAKVRHVLLLPCHLPTTAAESPCPRSRICVCRSLPGGR